MNSKAVALADKILSQRDNATRENKNLLVFVAAAANRLGELRGETRSHLAWKSIAADHESLQLTPAQKKQAEDKITETSKAVDSLIGEAFTLVMTPKQTPGTPDIEWQTTKASPTGPLPERVAKKLATEEKLIEQYGGVRVKMDIDQHNLWSERGDITVRELWARYASLPYLPRLASATALDLAISNGTSNFNWANETFGYAEAHDGSKYVGVVVGEMVTPSPSGLVLRPDVVALEEDEVSPPDSYEEADEDTAAGSTARGGGNPQSGTPTPGSFYAVFDLDRLRGATQMSDIIDHIAAHLGENTSLTLELRADSTNGFDDATRRTVSENAANLNATAAEFEQGTA